MKKLMRKKLALMLSNLKRKRPFYTEVEYLESSGTQYIETSIVPTPKTEFETRARIVAVKGNACFFGATSSFAWNNESNSAFALGNSASSSGSIFFVYSNSGQALTPQNVGVRTDFTAEFKNYTLKIDGTTIQTYTAIDSWTNAMPALNIFSRRIASSSDDTKGKYRIYYLKLWDDGSLVGDFIPVLDWEMTPCMYDRVTEQLFYNQGTGNFTAGREIHYVDYLESTGTQYVDTGIYLTNNHSVEIDYQLTSTDLSVQARKGLYGGLVTSRHGALLSPTNRYLEAGYGEGNNYYQLGMPDTNRHVLYQKKNELYFDGALTYTFAAATFTQASTAPLGNFDYTNYNPAYSKYYSSRWWDGDTLVRDYKPAIDENGVGFLFDKVTHTIFDNAGTGVFKYPPVELEYIGTNGISCYIDTGYSGNSNDIKVESIFSTTSTVQYAPIYGNAINEDQANWGLIYNNNSNSLAYFNSRRNYGLQAPVYKTDGTWNEMEMHREGTTGYTTINGVTVSVAIPYDGSENTANIIVGKAGPNRAPASERNNKFKTFKIYNNNVLVRDLIPAFKSGSAGMLDKVNNVFYANAGTGSMIAGKIIESEYLE